jgi:ferritin-like metal-binding protein YciE
MPQMTDPRELFVHELGDILYAENLLVKALPKMASEASNEELRSGFEEHLDETKQHVENLKQVFSQIGEPANPQKCPGIEGIKAEHDEFMKEENPSPELCDMFLTGAAGRVEHYEIAAYTGLVTLANALGEPEAAKLLQQNLQQETAAAEKIASLSRELAKSAKEAVSV